MIPSLQPSFFFMSRKSLIPLDVCMTLPQQDSVEKSIIPKCSTIAAAIHGRDQLFLAGMPDYANETRESRDQTPTHFLHPAQCFARMQCDD